MIFSSFSIVFPPRFCSYCTISAKQPARLGEIFRASQFSRHGTAEKMEALTIGTFSSVAYQYFSIFCL